MPRILVVYYSRSGTTREIARRLSRSLRADLEEIIDPTPRAGVLGFVRSAIEARREQIPAISPAQQDPAAYDLVVIGTPVWMASVSTPVRAYLRRHRGNIRAAAFFCTCGHSGGGRALQQMEEECKLAPVVRMHLRQEEIATVSAELAIERFVSECIAAASASAA